MNQVRTNKLQKWWKRDKKLRSKRYILLMFSLVILPVSLLASGYEIYSASYSTNVSLAQTSATHLQNAANRLRTLAQQPLDEHGLIQVQEEFTLSVTGFTQLKSNLGMWSLGTQLPVYGSRLSTAFHLAGLAINISEAGIAGCKMLNVLLTGVQHALPASEQGSGLTMEDIARAAAYFRQVETALHQAIAEANQVQPDDVQSLGAHISELFATFRKEVPAMQVWLGAVDKVIPVLPVLLGLNTPANYLVEVLDATELRPAGGFIGNYGIVSFARGRLISAHITDVELLDRPFEAAGHVIPYPATYTWFPLAPASWSFRDSNLDADFPTAARYGETLYAQEGGNVSVLGTIAITPLLIQNVLEVIGPISVPEYHETITPQNLITRIHFYQLSGKATTKGDDTSPSAGVHSSARKHFIALLAEYMLARIKQLPQSLSFKLIQSVISAVRSKDLQIYLNNSDAEQILQVLNLSGAIQAPTGDGLFVVDANIGGNKANGFITTTLRDEVTIDERGNATHYTRMSYAWTLPGPVYGPPVYRDYVRVYVPPGSTLIVYGGWRSQRMSTEFGSQAWAGIFTLIYGQTQTLTFIWTVPGAAKQDRQGWHYQYLAQKQAGIERKLEVHIQLPPCATKTSAWGGFVSHDSLEAGLTSWLTEDLNPGVDFVCR